VHPARVRAFGVKAVGRVSSVGRPSTSDSGGSRITVLGQPSVSRDATPPTRSFQTGRRQRPDGPRTSTDHAVNARRRDPSGAIRQEE